MTTSSKNVLDNGSTIKNMSSSQIPTVWKLLLQDISMQTQSLSLWHRCCDKAFKGNITAAFSPNQNEKASCNILSLNVVCNRHMIQIH